MDCTRSAFLGREGRILLRVRSAFGSSRHWQGTLPKETVISQFPLLLSSLKAFKGAEECIQTRQRPNKGREKKDTSRKCRRDEKGFKAHLSQRLLAFFLLLFLHFRLISLPRETCLAPAFLALD